MSKKIVALILSLMLVLSLVACGGEITYTSEGVEGGPTAQDNTLNNGSAVVQKGDFLFFVNNVRSVASKNVFGETVEGSLVRTNLDGTNPVIIQKKLVSNESGTGLFIYGDKIFYTSPGDTVDRNGSVEYSFMDLMMCDLNGANTKKLVTLDSQTTKVAFLEENGTVYAVYAKGGEIKSIDLSLGKKEAKVILDSFSEASITRNGIFYSANELENEVSKGYQSLFSLTPTGTSTRLVEGTSGKLKFTIDIKKVQDGKIFYSMKDSVLTLENSLYVKDLNGNNAPKKITSIDANDTIFPYDGGEIVVTSSYGTAYFKNGNVTKLSTKTLDIVGIYADDIIYSTTSSEKASISKLNITKALEGEEVITKMLLISPETTDEDGDKVAATYDTIYVSPFEKFIIIGDYGYFYSADQTSKDLYSVNLKTDEIKSLSTKG